ncbi:MAG: hypothetical protein U0800_16120 [Isosphaeraceae bacterium]
MPTFTRPHRRIAATLALIAFAVAPTTYVGWTALAIRRPEHLRQAEAEVGRALGLSVRLDRVRYPRPGEAVYEGVSIRHREPRSESHAEIAHADRLIVGRAHRELRLTAEGLRLSGDGPRQVLEQVADWIKLDGVGQSGWDRVTLLAPSCRVELGGSDLAFQVRDLAGTYQADRGAPTFSASCRVIEGDSTTRCELTLTRDRQGASVRNLLTVATREGAPLPGRALRPFFDATGWLGEKATVVGELALRQREGHEWEADFRGDLGSVDLDSLVGRRFGEHRMSGLAKVAIRSARWGDRGPLGFGWIDAEGTIAAGSGSISRSMLDAIGRQLRFRTPESIGPLGPDLPFDSMAMGFRMAEDGALKLSGELGPDHPRDAVLIDAKRVLAASPREPGDVRGLVNALFSSPADTPDLLVPTTAESQGVQRYLPMGRSVAASP